MRSKLYVVLTGILCFCVVVACEIPQSVTVKGNPGIYLNMGSPFGDENILVDKFLSVDGIKEQMGPGFNGRIYAYQGDAEAINTIQTYLISIPLIPAFTPTVSGQLQQNGNPSYSGTIPDLALHAIGDFLGGAEFITVPGYLYVTGLDSGGTMALTYTISGKPTATALSTTLIDPGNNFRTITAFSDKGENVKTWTNADTVFDNVAKTVELNAAFNAKSNVTLGYTITGNVTQSIPVKADLVIKLPLKFNAPAFKDGVSQKVTLKDENGVDTEYIKLDLDALPKGEEDLLGREEGNDDDLFKQLSSVKAYVQTIENTAIDDLKLGIKKNGITIPLDNNPGANYIIPFADSALDPPFNPGFLVLVKSVPNIIIVKPQEDGVDPKFDFKLALEAKAGLNITEDL